VQSQQLCTFCFYIGHSLLQSASALDFSLSATSSFPYKFVIVIDTISNLFNIAISTRSQACLEQIAVEKITFGK